MAKLIDTQKALEIVRFECGEWTGLAKTIENRFNELPSVEAEPVRHGHWLRTGRTNVYGGFEVECSVCNDNVMITNIEYEHYCRNCGARMDEGSE